MKIDFRYLWKQILNPPTWAKVLTFIITLLSATLSLVTVGVGLENGALAIVAYILFAVAGVSLTYSLSKNEKRSNRVDGKTQFYPFTS